MSLSARVRDLDQAVSFKVGYCPQTATINSNLERKGTVRLGFVFVGFVLRSGSGLG